MALDKTKIASASNQQNDTLPRVHVYVTADAKADVDDANYWAGAFGDVRVGDWILCQCADGGVALYVTAITATTSAVTKLTPA